MEYLELVLRFSAMIGLFIWLGCFTFLSYKVTKGSKYLQVKQQYRNVEKAKIKAKYEYKLAVLDYKSQRDKRRSNK